MCNYISCKLPHKLHLLFSIPLALATETVTGNGDCDWDCDSDCYCDRVGAVRVTRAWDPHWNREGQSEIDLWFKRLFCRPNTADIHHAQSSISVSLCLSVSSSPGRNRLLVSWPSCLASKMYATLATTSWSVCKCCGIIYNVFRPVRSCFFSIDKHLVYTLHVYLNLPAEILWLYHHHHHHSRDRERERDRPVMAELAVEEI